MTNENIELSIVVPMHNEQECLIEYFKRTTITLDKLKIAYEIVIVNDGSTDKTEDIIREISSKDQNLVGINLARNRGQCTAIYAGIQQCKGNYIVIMDGDLQHKPEEIPLLYNKIKKGYDFVSGDRKNRSESFLLKRIPSKIANSLIRYITKCPVKDMGGFSCMNGDIARSLTLKAGQHRLLPAIVYMMGGSVSEVPVSAPKRFAGQSHYGIGRSIDVFFDIVMLWFQNSFKQRPLYLFGRVSLTLFIFASALFGWVLYGKLILLEPMGSRPPFLISIFLYLCSFGFITVAFISENLSNIYDLAGEKRNYVIREIFRKYK